MISEGREEDLYLEFKQKVDRRNGDLDVGDKRAFSKALSAFANADGGVLVFGIETAKGPEGVDRAASLKPLSDGARFRGRLLDSILQATQPVVDDVQIDFVASNDGAGYVKVLIPQSSKPPHRAILAEHMYWRRVSTGTRRMEHYELEDTFGRRLRPKLRFFGELRSRPEGDPHEELHFFLLNEGRGVARHSGFHCKLGAGVKVAGAQGVGLHNASHFNQGAAVVSYSNDTSVIHANDILLAVGHAIILREDKAIPLLVNCAWYAEGMDARRAEGGIFPGDFHRFGE